MEHLSDFYTQLDSNLMAVSVYDRFSSSNPLLFDVEGLINIDRSFFNLQATKFDSQTTELAETRTHQLEKAQDDLTIIKLQYLQAKN